MTSKHPRYEVVMPLSAGGMATVYLGRAHGELGFARWVAIKRPHAFVLDHPSLRQALEREAAAAARIHHPNVVAVLDVTHVDGENVLVLEYVEGCTLRELWQCEALSVAHKRRAGLRVVLDVARGLHASHTLTDARGTVLGLVHRDVSPQNMLLDGSGTAKLSDFGLAKFAHSSEEPTRSDGIKGKARYMPPEYIEHRRFDARGDQYSLAVVAWEVLTAERLFDGATELEIVRRVTSQAAPTVSSRCAELAPFDDIVGRAMAAAHERYADVATFAAALEQRARELGILGSAQDVVEAVSLATGERLVERRRQLAALGDRATTPLSSWPRPPEPTRSVRDEQATLSLGVDDAAAHARERGIAPTRQGKGSRRAASWLAGLALALASVDVAVGIGDRAMPKRSVLLVRGVAVMARSSLPLFRGGAELSPPSTSALAAPSRVAPVAASASKLPPRSRPRPDPRLPLRAPPNPYGSG